MPTRKTRSPRKTQIAVAVFRQKDVSGECVAKPVASGVQLTATFTALPQGKHGFHIHTAGDLRGEGCKGACAHYHKGEPTTHGDEPSAGHRRPRHTGDLGNIELPSNGSFTKTYVLKKITVQDLWGRSLIVHADEDDLGLGDEEDSKTTGHSGARIACAIFGRATEMC
jgi:superoxide dismutase, Cu-Zn family